MDQNGYCTIREVPTKDLGQNEDKDEEAEVGEVQRGESTAAYFSQIESKIK